MKFKKNFQILLNSSKKIQIKLYPKDGKLYLPSNFSKALMYKDYKYKYG